MPGTKEGGLKAAKTNRAKWGSDFYRKLGKIGGSKRTPKTKNKGFASDRLRASISGAKGGRISRRRKVVI